MPDFVTEFLAVTLSRADRIEREKAGRALTEDEVTALRLAHFLRQTLPKEVLPSEAGASGTTVPPVDEE